jgi:flagellar motility protein MotE (MotC chaperone)
VILVILVLAIGGALAALKFGVVKPPAALAQQPWMASFLPKPTESEEPAAPVEVSVENALRQQVLDLNRQNMAAQATIESLRQQLDEKDQTILAREDDIAKLRSAVSLAASQNVASVALVYEAMEPAQAATILANLGAEHAALILGAMRESKAADVMALMDPTLATQITQLMAGFTPNPAAPTLPPTGGSGATPPGTTGPTVPPAGTAPTTPGQGQA